MSTLPTSPTTPVDDAQQVNHQPPRKRWYNWTPNERKNFLTAMIFVLPWIIGFLAFIVYPVFYTFQLSFTQYGGFGDPNPIGWANYERLLTDQVFRTTLFNTFYYTALAVPIGAVVAMVLALAMNQPVKEIPLYRVILFLPSVLPLFALSFIVWALLDPNQGIVNELLRSIGLNPPNWFGDPQYAMIGIVAVAQFGAGQIALIFLAGLKGIPQHLYEAAMLDGAGVLSRFRNVTLPLMTPIILYNVILGLSQGLQVFTQIFIITSGGPAGSTRSLVLYLYENAFQYGNQMGYASAIGVVLFFITFALAYVVFKTSDRWVHYDMS